MAHFKKNTKKNFWGVLILFLSRDLFLAKIVLLFEQKK